MNLEQLKYFIDVCETGNMTQSAKKFYISPQGLNKSLRSLQKELDVDLLIFQQRKTEMTEKDGSITRRSRILCGSWNRSTTISAGIPIRR